MKDEKLAFSYNIKSYFYKKNVKIFANLAFSVASNLSIDDPSQ